MTEFSISGVTFAGMSNTYFQFKQFTIHQEHCAMKVCTDACLFGAWVADLVYRGQVTGKRVLDIGVGTGLLSLMVAQKIGGEIDGVEIDEAAAEQAAANFEESPWSDRFSLLKIDARNIESGKLYDFIISNPPFFENDLESPDDKRNLALHSSALSFSELIGVIKKHLADNGNFGVLLPYHRKETFVKSALATGFYLNEEVNVKQTTRHPYFRSMLLFGGSDRGTIKSEIIIRDGENYSIPFRRLLKDYYLKL